MDDLCRDVDRELSAARLDAPDVRAEREALRDRAQALFAALGATTRGRRLGRGWMTPRVEEQASAVLGRLEGCAPRSWPSPTGRFERLGADRFLVGNMVGDMAEMTAAELDRLCNLDIAPGDGLYERAYEKLFVGPVEQRAQQQLLALRLRSRLSFLRAATPLHLFVVTLRCEHSCPYCQVSRQSKDRVRYDMDQATASKALDIALSAPVRTDQDRVSRRRASLELRTHPMDCRRPPRIERRSAGNNFSS